MTVAEPARRPRLESVDAVRGVMMIMALDHTRDFFGVPGDNPTNLATASTALFLTRWITHFCAPVCFLLTGTGAYLSLRKKTTAERSQATIGSTVCGRRTHSGRSCTRRGSC